MPARARRSGMTRVTAAGMKKPRTWRGFLVAGALPWWDQGVVSPNSMYSSSPPVSLGTHGPVSSQP